jgi:hypothetical protein
MAKWYCAIREAMSRLRTPGGKAIFSLAALPFFVTLSGCHSYQVAITVENRTGAPVQLLEVDYPSASFGADVIGSGADFHYRVQLRGSGPIKVQYTAAGEHQVQLTGPDLHEAQQGRLEIVVQPGGKAQFLPQLTP